MDDYLAKPIRVEELVNALSESRPRQHEGATSVMSESVLDKSVLEGLVATTDAQFVAELLAAFLEDSPQLVAQMRQAFADKDADTFRRAAHSLKSNSANFGALNLSALAKELEMMGKAGQIEGAGVKLERLATDYAEVERELRAWQHAS
jgi:HPt (histidine-containing phosphotransfer) domain-containing protein